MKKSQSKLRGIGLQFFAAPGGRLNEIETRLSAIAQELEKDDADVEALERETRSLKEEKDAIVQDAERRRKLREQIAAGGGWCAPSAMKAGRSAPTVWRPRNTAPHGCGICRAWS